MKTENKDIFVNYDGDIIKLTQEYIDAIESLLKAEILMMRELHNTTKDCWVIGVATIKDLSSSNGVSMSFGSEEDEYYLKDKGQIMVKIPL